MSSNIYEDPNLTTTVRYSKGVQKDRGERQERLVDIYESAVTFTDQRGSPSTRNGGELIQKRPAVQRNPFRAAALVLGLLCLLLIIAAVTVLFQLYQLNIRYKSRYEELQTRYDNLNNELCQSQNSTGEKGCRVILNDLISVHETFNLLVFLEVSWRIFRCSCYYKSTETKNWTESRKDCEIRGAELVSINSREEQDFVSKLNEHGASWIGLQSVQKDTWEVKWEWEWLDGSPIQYLVWQKDVNSSPEKQVTAYIDPEGKLNHAKNGSRGWICEKPI
uniref:C-type lectin domain family 12 member B-like isoform X1 n=1 Tax=Semicossyphus pulcher TaxID=241346 RepID=UPI0037E76D8C